MSVKCICDCCKKEFDRSVTDIRKNEKRGYKHSFCSRTCYDIFNASNPFELVCTYCKVSFLRAVKDNNSLIRRATKLGIEYLPFCSRRCQGKYVRANNNKTGITRTINCEDCKIVFEISFNDRTTLKCPKCDCIYCEDCGVQLPRYSSGKRKRRSNALYCDDCRLKRATKNGSKGGKKSASVQQRRSKNEIYFADLCQKQFSNITTNEQFFIDTNGNKWDADVMLHDHKVAVLWNGQWHYKQISKKQSLAQVQARDKIKLSVIETNGYAAYVIKDMGKYNPKFVEEEFDKFVEWIIKNNAIPTNQNRPLSKA